MGVVIGIAVFFLSPWIAEDMLHAPALTDDMRISSLILFLNSFNGAQIGALQGLQAFKRIATINVAQSLVSAPVFIVGAYYWGVRGSVWAFAFYSIIVCFFAYIAIRKELRNKNIRVSYCKWNDVTSFVCCSKDILHLPYTIKSYILIGWKENSYTQSLSGNAGKQWD